MRSIKLIIAATLVISPFAASAGVPVVTCTVLPTAVMALFRSERAAVLFSAVVNPVPSCSSA